MQVILLEKIQKLGNLGDLTNVKSGYARNFLIPKGKAKPATAANIAEFEGIKMQLEAKAAAEFKAAQEKEAAMRDTVCIVRVNVGDEGKLFGAVSTADIKASLAANGFEVEKRDIQLSEPIRFVGEYEISLFIHSDISITTKLIVQALETQE